MHDVFAVIFPFGFSIMIYWNWWRNQKKGFATNRAEYWARH